LRSIKASVDPANDSAQQKNLGDVIDPDQQYSEIAHLELSDLGRGYHASRKPFDI
jgi:hypothetical protein